MLEIRDLVKVYPGPVTALCGIGLSIPRGLFGLLGPNGSGKTTLMRILAGLLEPTSGRVSWDGEDVTDRPELVRPRLGYLPQEFGFYPNLTGEAMLRHLLALKGVEAPGGPTRLAAELLERVHLTFAAKRKVKTYSGGMRQRLGIAQCIAGAPELIIVDEPTAGLDPEERVRFYGILAELACERTVLLSTHIVEDVAVLCPRFAVIRHGRLLATTTPAEARARLAGTIYEGEVSHADHARLAETARITRSYLYEGRNRVRIQVDGQPPPVGFTRAEPTVEDAYFLLTREAPAGASPATQIPVRGSA